MIWSDARFRRILAPFIGFAALLQVLLFTRVIWTTPTIRDSSLTLLADSDTISKADPLQPTTLGTLANVESTNSSLPRPHPHAGARYPDGTLGYVADPSALRRGMEDFLQTQEKGFLTEETAYWKALLHYESGFRNSTTTGNEILSPEYVCVVGPGRGFEKDGGYKLLTEKIKIRGRVDNDKAQRPSSPKILCAIYTYPRMHDLFRTVALSYGYKCDGFLAFSTETVPELGLVDLLHEGEESYNNMWQKVRIFSWFGFTLHSNRCFFLNSLFVSWSCSTKGSEHLGVSSRQLS